MGYENGGLDKHGKYIFTLIGPNMRLLREKLRYFGTSSQNSSHLDCPNTILQEENPTPYLDLSSDGMIKLDYDTYTTLGAIS